MANKDILELPVAIALSGAEYVPLVQSDTTKRATTALLAGLVGTVTATTVAALPTAASAGAGARAFVTDANSTTFLATAVGGGANKVPVVSNGTAWVIG